MIRGVESAPPPRGGREGLLFLFACGLARTICLRPDAYVYACGLAGLNWFGACGLRPLSVGGAGGVSSWLALLERELMNTYSESNKDVDNIYLYSLPPDQHDGKHYLFFHTRLPQPFEIRSVMLLDHKLF